MKYELTVEWIEKHRGPEFLIVGGDALDFDRIPGWVCITTGETDTIIIRLSSIRKIELKESE